MGLTDYFTTTTALLIRKQSDYHFIGRHTRFHWDINLREDCIQVPGNHLVADFNLAYLFNGVVNFNFDLCRNCKKNG